MLQLWTYNHPPPTSLLLITAIHFSKLTVEHFRYDDSYNVFVPAQLNKLSAPAILATFGLGFCLSMLFFMDQNIGSAMVNNPCNK